MKNKQFFTGLTAMVLAIGLVLAGCEDGSTDDGPSPTPPPTAAESAAALKAVLGANATVNGTVVTLTGNAEIAAGVSAQVPAGVTLALGHATGSAAYKLTVTGTLASNGGIVATVKESGSVGTDVAGTIDIAGGGSVTVSGGGILAIAAVGNITGDTSTAWTGANGSAIGLTIANDGYIGAANVASGAENGTLLGTLQGYSDVKNVAVYKNTTLASNTSISKPARIVSPAQLSLIDNGAASGIELTVAAALVIDGGVLTTSKISGSATGDTSGTIKITTGSIAVKNGGVLAITKKADLAKDSAAWVTTALPTGVTFSGGYFGAVNVTNRSDNGALASALFGVTSGPSVVLLKNVRVDSALAIPAGKKLVLPQSILIEFAASATLSGVKVNKASGTALTSATSITVNKADGTSGGTLTASVTTFTSTSGSTTAAGGGTVTSTAAGTTLTASAVGGVAIDSNTLFTFN